jgi:hypothetical protein
MKVITMPNKQKFTSKLSAIMSADVKGCSILMSEDEFFSIQTLKAYRQIMAAVLYSTPNLGLLKATVCSRKTNTRHSQKSVQKQGGINDEKNGRN